MSFASSVIKSPYIGVLPLVKSKLATDYLRANMRTSSNVQERLARRVLFLAHHNNPQGHRAARGVSRTCATRTHSKPVLPLNQRRQPGALTKYINPEGSSRRDGIAHDVTSVYPGRSGFSSFGCI